uniref:reverse transcriptase domain-containing protein n=1 Tax=Rhodohalobacter sp. 8-1 TaxID=3131972 RepID=UPI0030EE1EB3
MPQGSPLSPLLSNILLNELDRELEKRGHRYVRYADDFSIYVRSKRAARRVGNSIYLFLRDVLRLPINREKSGIRRPSTFDILGYHFVPVFKKGVRGQYQLVVSAKSRKAFKRKLKEADPQNHSHKFCRTNPAAQPADTRLAELLQTGQYPRQITSTG